MLKPIFSNRFKQDYKLMLKRHRNIDKLTNVLANIIWETPLSERYHEHPLLGNWNEYLECHVEPDWILIYKINALEKEVYFSRTGTHSDLY